MTLDLTGRRALLRVALRNADTTALAAQHPHDAGSPA